MCIGPVEHPSVRVCVCVSPGAMQTAPGPGVLATAHYGPKTWSGTPESVKQNFSDRSETFSIGTEFIRDAESVISFISHLPT